MNLMEITSSQSVAIRDVNTSQPMQEVSLTAKDGLFIATECHLALFPDEDGDTALHLAAVQGDFEPCRKLVDLFRIAGKSIDVHNKLLQTPLHVAIITNHKEIVKLLICHGSDPNNPDRYGSTGFHLCAKFNQPECLVEIFQNMGARKPNLNFRDYEGQTALHVAVMHGSVATFKLLVANGADIDAKDNKGGRTPLIYAIEMNERSIVELLLECDASVSQQTYSGDTALHIASGRGQQEIVRLLLRRGADATLKNTHSETPISLATSPSVSDILRTQCGLTALPETKALTMADTQYASYVARNIAVPMPPNFLKIFSASSVEKGSPPAFVQDQSQLQKKARKLKIEHDGFGSDEATPPKRPFVNILTSPTTSTPHVCISQIAADRTPMIGVDFTGLPHNFTVKHEFQDFRPTQDEDGGSSSRGSDIRDDEASKWPSDFSDEHVEIAMEEVEVSAEEEVQTKSDDESSPESHPLSLQDSPRKNFPLFGAAEQPYTHKLMQCSTSNNEKESNHIGSKENHLSEENIVTNSVIVQRQPQIDIATALSREYKTNFEANPSFRNFTPSASPRSSIASQAISKSKSVPNSPQPAEANLYQLAREGLAVAAMANANPYQSTGREIGLSSYLKARPSRQAKIKSGTEELQNLALQGLAVAAMNAQSELFKQATGKKPKSAEEGDTPSNLTAVPKYLGQILNPAKEGQPPTLHRSNSMPPKQYFERKTPPDASSALNPFSSNNALLALAHANAKKEHVGQAVSAKSMARTRTDSLPKFQHPVATTVSFTPNEVSEDTKVNLRQAIMVKNPTTLSQILHPVEIYDPKRKKHYELDNPVIKTFDSKLGTRKTLSIKILPTNTKKNLTPPVRFAKLEDPMKGQLPAVFMSQSTFTMPVAISVSKSDALKPKSPVFSVVKVSLTKKISTTVPSSSQQSHSSGSDEKVQSHSSGSDEKVPMNLSSYTAPQAKTSISQQIIKPTKDFAPTQTVAPLQLPMNKGIARKTESDKQQTLISVAMAPVVTSRVSKPPSQVPSVAPKNETDNSSASTTQQQLTLPTNAVLPTSTVSGVTNGFATLPSVALGGLQPQVLNPALSNFGLVGAHTASPYLQHQIAYVPHGKDLIPVIVPHGAFQPQVQLPSYPAAALQIQSSQTANNGTRNVTSIGSTAGDVNFQLSQAYFNSVSNLSAIDPNLLYRMPLPLQEAQLRGLYPLYGTQVQQPMDLNQHQQLLTNSWLYQQSLLAQNNARASQLLTGATGIMSKPVAAVSAVPVQKSIVQMPLLSSAKMATQCADDQPLNLSKRPAQTDQPLNLMMAHSAARVTARNESLFRSSVIKAVSSVHNEPPKATMVNALNTANRGTGPHIAASHTGFYLPPPVILNPAAAVPHATQSAALSALSLPPIHYVNGMPFILGAPPQL